MAAETQNWFERAIGTVAPRMQLRRARARIATDLLLRHYEGASSSWRTQNWNRSASDANTALGFAALSRLREVARDLVRNNPYAESALATIADHIVGWGISAKPTQKNDALALLWNAWAETTACDADGRHDLYGLQKLIASSVAESGEVLVRRRFRLPSDGLPIPLQLQVLEADMLDTHKTIALPNGGQIVQGVEFDPIGNRVAYWLFPVHPGATLRAVSSSNSTIFSPSRRIPATEILHIFKTKRPGQVRAATWFAPVILRMKEFDEFEDATLMKQKIAACLAVITTDVDGTAPGIGTPNDSVKPLTDMLSPGSVLSAGLGQDVTVVQPPSAGDYAPYCNVTLRAIATGLGVTYEDLTGDYTGLPFSAARMSRIRHWARVEDWRWRMLIPQFCNPVWMWTMQAIALLRLVPGVAPGALPTARWTPPPMPMLDPDKEGTAYQRLVRNGFESFSEVARERGYDPDELLAEIAADNKKLDALGLKLDSDPRFTTQVGQLQGAGAPKKPIPGAAV